MNTIVKTVAFALITASPVMSQNSKTIDILSSERVKSTILKDKEACFDIDTVSVEGAVVLPKAQLSDLLVGFQGQCLGLNSIQYLQESLVKIYQDAGYIVSQVVVPEQDLGRGILVFHAIEGQVEAITWNGDVAAGRGHVETAFLGHVDRPVNIRDVEQAMRQLGRMKSIHTEMELLPGRESGDTIINVAAKREKIGTFSYSINNHNAHSSGALTQNFSASFDGLIGGGDVHTISTRFSGGEGFGADHFPQGRDISLVSSMPFGFGTVTGKISSGQSLQQYMSGPLEVTPRTRTESYSLGVSYDLYDVKRGKLSFSSELKHQRKKSFLGIGDIPEVMTAVSSYALTSARFGLDLNTSTKTNSAALSIGYRRGLERLNSEANAPFSHFETLSNSLFEVSASLSKQFVTEHFGPLSYNASLSGQISRDKLPSEWMFSIGGHSSIRGTTESYSGASGVYLRQELSAPFLTQETPLPSTMNLSGFLGVDIGHVIIGDNKEDAPNTASLSGATLGLRANFPKENAFFELSYSDIFKRSGRADYIAPDVLVAPPSPNTGIFAANFTVRF